MKLNNLESADRQAIRKERKMNLKNKKKREERKEEE